MKVKMSEIESKQKKDILCHLLEGKPLTKLGALLDYGVWNSGDVIHKLRKEYGYGFIITDMVISNGKSHAVYKVDFDFITINKLEFVD